MKKIAKGMAVVLVVMFCMATYCVDISYAADKMGYVDLRVIFDGYAKTKDVDEKIANLATQKQEERDAIVDVIRTLKDEMVLLAEGDAKVAKQAEIDQKIQELQQFDEATRQELTQIRDENVKEIFDDIDATVNAYGDKKGYDLIFSDRALVFKTDKYDITENILKELNKKE